MMMMMQALRNRQEESNEYTKRWNRNAKRFCCLDLSVTEGKLKLLFLPTTILTECEYETRRTI